MSEKDTKLRTEDEETRRDWEEVQTNQNDKTERLRVQNGWLYRTVVGSTTPGVALVFIPGRDA